MNQPLIFRNVIDCSRILLVGSGRPCLGRVCGQRRAKEEEDVFLKDTKKLQKHDYFGGLSTTATEILFSSCWGAIWLVFER